MGSRFGPCRYPGADAPKYVPGEPTTWDEWVDATGQTYRPGDFVAVATINGKSPQMVFGQVVKINRINSKKELILESEWHYEDCEPGDKGAQEIVEYKRVEKGPNGYPQHVSVRTGKYRKQVTEYTSSCTVTVQPLINGRGFSRWSGTKPKVVTYQLWGNIVKIDGTAMKAKMEADLRAEEERLRALGEDVSELLQELAELKR